MRLGEERPMADTSRKSLIFISYAHADEPDKGIDGAEKWLSFVTNFLKAAAIQDVIEIWTDNMMLGGEEWDPEIERKLRECDIFLLLISVNSLSSDYIIRREIEVVRERQTNGEDVRFYPLLLTPTPSIGLELVRDKNWRPKNGRPLSSFPLNDRQEQMVEVADEIVSIARKMSLAGHAEKSRVTGERRPSQPEPRDPSYTEMRDGVSLEAWLAGMGKEVALAIAGRAALRAVPVLTYAVEKPLDGMKTRALVDLTVGTLRATAVARVAAKYPDHANQLRTIAAEAGRAVSDAISRTFGTAVPSAANDRSFDTVRGDLATAAACAARSTAFAAFAAYAVEYPRDASVTAVTYFVAAAAGVRASAAVLGITSREAEDDSAAAFRAITSTRAATVANRAAWAEIASDAAMVQDYGLETMIDKPLWTRGAPDWATDAWVGLRAALPIREDWEVWFDWYENRVRGGSRGEDYEQTFVSVPSDYWNQGSAKANAWMSSELLRKSVSKRNDK
jgi:TIR domain